MLGCWLRRSRRRLRPDAFFSVSENSQLNLPEADRAFLVALFQECIPGAQVWAYGSRVSGHGHPGSDLDLVVRAKAGSLPGEIMTGLRARLRASRLPIGVDLHDWATLPPAFQKEIAHQHLVLVA